MRRPTITIKSFTATLIPGGRPLNWTIIRIPFDVQKVWGTRGHLKVQGDINGFAFRTSLFPDGKGSHTMIVNKQMQKGAGVRVGAQARFRLQPDLDVREVAPPKELTKALAASKRLAKYFDSLNYSMRHEIAKQIAQPKSAEARTRRAEQMAERLMETMEAERELPPLIALAMARNPKARSGWELMTPAQRRGQLLGIFYYRQPDSRARRLDKAMQLAEQTYEKRIGRQRNSR